MKYRYYGTAAGEGIPALWCECDVCKRAREKGGRNIMTRSQQLIDDKILIDFTCDTYTHCIQGLPLTKIRTCLLTHSHGDHLYAIDINMRLAWFAHLKEESTFTVYSMRPGIEEIESKLEEEPLRRTPNRVKLEEIVPFESFEVEGYTVTPLKADHVQTSGCVIYLIEKDGKCVLHANDTGYFPDETWEFLKNYKGLINFASFDCTETGRASENDRHTNHMNLVTCCNVRNKLKEFGIANDDTIFVLNHFSHNGQYIYDELVEVGGKEGFLVAYNGLEVEF